MIGVPRLIHWLTSHPRCLVLGVMLSSGLCQVCGLAAEADDKRAIPIHRSILSDRADYHGPEREEPEPVDIQEVRIGFFAPRDSHSPVGQNLWRGAEIAVEQANLEGGYRGKPFRLICRWANNPWGAGSTEMTRLVYSDKVWAVVGSIDGAATHVAEQVATRARITLVSPLSGDPGLTHTAVPWMFRLPPDDASVAEALSRIAVQKRGLRRIILLTSADHDGRTGALELLRVLKRLRASPMLHLNFDPSQTDFSQQIDRISSLPAEAIFVWGTPEPSLRLLLALRRGGTDVPIFGPALCSLPSFLRKAGPAAEGLTTCKLVWNRNDTGRENFVRAFESRFGEQPADGAVLAYDAATIIVESIRKTGLNRARIRDAVVQMSGFVGLAGKITWDNGGGNLAVPIPVTIRDGQPCEIGD